jgi:hypothetical protein
MSMNTTTLKTAIKERFTTEGFDLDNPNAKSSKMIDIFCEEIISHIKNNAELVITNVSVTTYPVPAPPGTGTIL